MRALIAAIVIAASLGCTAARSPVHTAPAPQPPVEPRTVIFQDDLSPDLQVCVPAPRPMSGQASPVVCISLERLRQQLRAQRYARR